MSQPSDKTSTKKRLSFDLKARIFAVATLVAGCIIVVAALVDGWFLHRDGEAALTARATLMAALYAERLAGPMQNDDQAAIEATLAGLAEEAALSSAVLFGAGGERLGVIGGQGKARRIVVEQDVKRPGQAPGQAPGLAFGRLQLALSTAALEEAIFGQMLRRGAEALLLFLGLFVFGALMVQLYTRPINRLATTMSKLDRNDDGAEVPEEYLGRSDEIGAISRSLRQHQRQLNEEAKLLEVASALSSELHIDRLLKQVMRAATELLDADRSSLFIHDARTNELWTRLAEGLEGGEIRIPPDAGIVGACFESGETINVADAYSDDRFSDFNDRTTGYVTKTLLSMPITLKDGRRIGVTQVLNKRGGPFDERDELRLHALTAQVAAALENARLFDEVLNMRNYNESILTSLSNGVLAFDDDGLATKANQAALDILNRPMEEILGKPLMQIFAGANAWVTESAARVKLGGQSDLTLDKDIRGPDGTTVSVNLSVIPLSALDHSTIGVMLVFEDLSGEKRLRGTMARYLPKEVVDQVLEEGGVLLGGATQEVSILFSDIRRFTSISEELGPQDTVSMLNDYFTEMIEVIDAHSGILDKYIGDAIMAIFGAPFVAPQDADNAVAAALDMMLALRKLNASRRAKGLNEIEIGIGIATGVTIAGNIGSPKRMDYTVIGDAVNLASRLEGATKFYGLPILISERTRHSLAPRYLCREVDLIQVKGKSVPTPIYAPLIAWQPEVTEHASRLLDLNDHGIAAYRNRDWAAARARFGEILALDPSDRPAQLYLERCGYFEHHPPPGDWDGCWRMETK